MNRLMTPLDYLWALAHGTHDDPTGDLQRPQPPPMYSPSPYDQGQAVYAPPPPAPYQQAEPSGYRPLG
jgi:hypothetical protein